MKKVFKWIGISFLGIILLLVGAAVLVPIIFKDDIEKAMHNAVDENLNAKIYFDVDGFGVSLFKNFPNVSVTMEHFGLTGIDTFEKDTLVGMDEFQVDLNIKSLFSDKMSVNGIYLVNPIIRGLVQEDGKANWDIVKPSDEVAVEDTTEAAAFSLEIHEWVITNGWIIYNDKPGKMFAEIKGFNHSGSGEFETDLFDLITKTSFEAIDFEMEGDKYLSKNTFDAGITINIDNKNEVYTFKENEFKINDFKFGFDGSIKMKEMDFDLNFSAHDANFKSIISLVPAVFLEGFEEMKIDGGLKFDAFLKGKMEGDLLPAFGLDLQITEGKFQYPDLPTAIDNINIDLKVDNPSGDINKTFIDLKKMHADLGKNPIDIKATIDGLETIKIDADAKAKVNLADVNSLYPLDGIELKGMFELNALVKGVYDTLGSMPLVEAFVKIKDGEVKTVDFPVPVKDIQLDAYANVPQELSNAIAEVKSLHFDLDGEQFSASAKATNLLDDVNYIMDMAGDLNLDKMLKIFPLEGMEMTGLIKIHDFHTEGKMSIIDEERYQDLPTHGALEISNFTFTSKEDLPQGMTISAASMTFDPRAIALKSYNGTIGNSDMNMNGTFSNYMGYIFGGQDNVLRGKLDFNSTKFDVDEWMTEDTTAVAESGEVVDTSGAVEVPLDLDFVMDANMKSILYDGMDIQNFIGKVIVRDGKIDFKSTFGLIGAGFKMNGVYDTKNIAEPKVDYTLGISNLAFKKAYSTFTTVKKLAPVAESIDGEFDGDLHFSSLLGSDMMPLLETVNGDGLFKTLDASIKKLQLMDKVTSVTGFKGFDDIDISNTKIKFAIENGTVKLSPLEAKAGQIKMIMDGDSKLNGDMNYKMNLDVPSGQAGKAANGVLKSLGTNYSAGDDVKVDLGITGNMTDPEVKILGGGTKAKVQDAAKKEVQQQAAKVEENVKREATKEANKAVENVKKEGVKGVEKQASEVGKNTQKEVKDGLNKIKKPW